MSFESIIFRLDKISSKLNVTEPKIYYETTDGQHISESLIEFTDRIIHSNTSGIIRHVDLAKSHNAIGNGILYTVACVCDGYYETDNNGKVIIKTE